MLVLRRSKNTGRAHIHHQPPFSHIAKQAEGAYRCTTSGVCLTIRCTVIDDGRGGFSGRSACHFSTEKRKASFPPFETLRCVRLPEVKPLGITASSQQSRAQDAALCVCHPGCILRQGLTTRSLICDRSNGDTISQCLVVTATVTSTEC